MRDSVNCERLRQKRRKLFEMKDKEAVRSIPESETVSKPVFVLQLFYYSIHDILLRV